MNWLQPIEYSSTNACEGSLMPDPIFFLYFNVQTFTSGTSPENALVEFQRAAISDACSLLIFQAKLIRMALRLVFDWRLRKVIASESDAKFIPYLKEGDFFGELLNRYGRTGIVGAEFGRIAFR